MNTLQQFYLNEVQREAVRAFMVECLRVLAADKALKGESVVGIKEANECVDKMFNELEINYGKVDKPVNNNSR